MTDRLTEVLPSPGHGDGAAAAALDNLQRLSRDLFKEYPPAKAYTQKSIMEESEYRFAEGKLLPERFILKLEAGTSTLSQIDGVFQAARNGLENAYPGSKPPPSNYYAINGERGGVQYAYVGIVGGADIGAPDTPGAQTEWDGLKDQDSGPNHDDPYETKERSCLGLPADSPTRAVSDAREAMYRRADAAKNGLPDTATQSEVDGRVTEHYEAVRQLDDVSLTEVDRQRDAIWSAYIRPYVQCMGIKDYY